LNLSYGTLEEHRNTVAMVRAAARKIGLPTAVLLDCPGRKRRTGDTRAVFSDHLQFAQDISLITSRFRLLLRQNRLKKLQALAAK